jgi:DNA topoisomerase-1
MSALVIVESPAKAKTIEKYLGKGYKVLASKGHIADLPKSGIGVDFENGFKPDYTVMEGKQKVIRELKAALAGKDELIIAVDPDREGEAIGWHVANRLGVIDLDGKRKKKEITLKRIVFTEITKQAVTHAIANPRDLDINLLNSQQARRILDRIVGYKLSPLLWKKIRYGLSAGRVQSVAVKFVVDREAERDAFDAEEYWKLFADLSVSKLNTRPTHLEILTENEEGLPELVSGQVRFELQKLDGKKPKLDKQTLASEITKQLLQVENWKISKIEQKQTKRYPKPPFTTSTLQQTAANWLGFSAKRTMSVAQKLYERGIITYMRTDSTNLSVPAIEAARSYISAELGAKYLPEKPIFYRTKAKVAQEAHEAIRPANFSLHPDKLDAAPEEVKLYRLIWQRGLACQMVPANLENVSLETIQELEHKLEFRANGQRLIFPGYLKIYPEKVSEMILPQLTENQDLYPAGIYSTQHFTQPPARFSEATLIKELEKYGIGRPSTYAPIISTIEGRKYVEKENSYFKPTDTGIVVTKLLAQNFQEIVDRDFTAKMEEDLDQVANGEKNWQTLLSDFYTPFAGSLKEKEASIVKDDFTVLGDAPAEIVCPVCSGKMIIKLGKYGRFYSCSKFPDCKGMLGMDGLSQEDHEKKALTPEFMESYEPAPQTDDGRPFLLKKGRFGEFWAHPDYPKVKDARPLALKPAKLLELYGEAPQTDDGRDFLFRQGRFGMFWAHPDYPKVKETVRIKAGGKDASDGGRPGGRGRSRGRWNKGADKSAKKTVAKKPAAKKPAVKKGAAKRKPAKK